MLTIKSIFLVNKKCSTRIHLNNLQFLSDLPWWFWGWDSFRCLVASCWGRYRMTVGCTGWFSYTTHRSRPLPESGIHHNYWPCSHTCTLLLKMMNIKFPSTSTSTFILRLKESLVVWERLWFLFYLVHHGDCPVVWDTGHPKVSSKAHCTSPSLQDKKTKTGRRIMILKTIGPMSRQNTGLQS